MIDVNKLAMFIASIPMQDAERAAMLRMIPRMPMRHLRVLFRLLQAEARALTKVEA